MRGTTNEKAFKEFKCGAKAMRFPIHGVADLDKAIAHFKEAIKIDAGVEHFEQAFTKCSYSRAWCRMAYAMVTKYLEGWAPESVLDDAGRYAKRGNELDPYDYDTHWDLAYWHWTKGGKEGKGNFEKAKEHYERAIELYDENPNIFVEASEVFVTSGDFERALALLAKGGRVKAMDYYHWNVAWTYYFKGMDDPTYYELGLAELRKMYWEPGEQHHYVDTKRLEAVTHARLEEWHMAGENPTPKPEEAAKCKDRAQQAMAQFLAGKKTLDGIEKEGKEWTLEDEKRQNGSFEKTELLDHWLGGCKLAGMKPG